MSKKAFTVKKRVDGNGRIDVVIELHRSYFSASELIEIINSANKDLNFRSDIELSSGKTFNSDGLFIRLSNKLI